MQTIEIEKITSRHGKNKRVMFHVIGGKDLIGVQTEPNKYYPNGTMSYLNMRDSCIEVYHSNDKFFNTEEVAINFCVKTIHDFFGRMGIEAVIKD